MNNSTDTINVRIVGDILIDNIDFRIWEYDYNTKKEKRYYSVNPYSIKVISIIEGHKQIEQMYLTPMEFEFGFDWNVSGNYLYSESYKTNWNSVLTDHDLIIHNQVFPTILIIHKAENRMKEKLIEGIWFREKIGILKLERKYRNSEEIELESWKLIGCEIK